METIKLQAQIGTDGILQIQTPTNFKNTSVEVVVLIKPINNVIAPSEEAQPRYNAWGKKTTKKSITEAIAQMQKLRQEIALPQASIGNLNIQEND